MPNGGTIRLNTKAMQTNTAGRTIYKQAVEGEGNDRKRVSVRKGQGQASGSPASLPDQPVQGARV